MTRSFPLDKNGRILPFIEVELRVENEPRLLYFICQFFIYPQCFENERLIWRVYPADPLKDVGTLGRKGDNQVVRTRE